MKDFKAFADKAGLYQGQIRINEIVHNGGWYDQTGLKLGWGDLAALDFLRVVCALPSNGVFIVLGEHDSYWDLPPEKEKNPGRDHILEKALFMITSDGVSHITDQGDRHEPFEREDKRFGGCKVVVRFNPMRRPDFRQFITRYFPAEPAKAA